MWKPVKINENELGLTATTIGELKKILENVPDHYSLSVTGTTFGMLMETEEEFVLFDEVSFLENLLIEQEESLEKE